MISATRLIPPLPGEGMSSGGVTRFRTCVDVFPHFLLEVFAELYRTTQCAGLPLSVWRCPSAVSEDAHCVRDRILVIDQVSGPLGRGNVRRLTSAQPTSHSITYYLNDSGQACQL